MLLHLGPVNFGDAILGVLAVFGLMLLWRPLARKLGDEVPSLTPLRVLTLFLGSAITVAIAAFLIDRFGPIDVKAYGTMLVVGMAAGVSWCMYEGARRGHRPAIFIDFAIYVLIGGIVGARLLFVLLEWGSYSAHPRDILAIWEGGLSFHGAVLGGLLAVLVFCHTYKKRLTEIIDIATPGLALGFAFGRIGCFLNGCCYGIPTSLPWGVRFPHATWENGTPILAPVHPTQLYASLASLLIFAVLYKFRDRMARPGHLFLFYLVLYSGWRFFVEELRYNATAAPFGPLPQFTVAQVASVLIMLAAAVTMFLTARWGGARVDRSDPGDRTRKTDNSDGAGRS